MRFAGLMRSWSWIATVAEGAFYTALMRPNQAKTAACSCTDKLPFWVVMHILCECQNCPEIYTHGSLVLIIILVFPSTSLSPTISLSVWEFECSSPPPFLQFKQGAWEVFMSGEYYMFTTFCPPRACLSGVSLVFVPGNIYIITLFGTLPAATCQKINAWQTVSGPGG